MHIIMRLGRLAPLALAGFLFTSAPKGAEAVVPVSAATPAAHITVQPSVVTEAAYYYYRGHRYPYRYHGMYYNHRYYRGGRYHYY